LFLSPAGSIPSGLPDPVPVVTRSGTNAAHATDAATMKKRTIAQTECVLDGLIDLTLLYKFNMGKGYPGKF
jgi:hypothetical protein